MNITRIRFTLGLPEEGRVFFVTPEHVTYIERYGDEAVRIHFVSGESIVVDGDLNSVGLALQGRG